jgi:hypothetical protein
MFTKRRIVALFLVLCLSVLGWAASGFSLIPLRLVLHAAGLTTGYRHCPPTGNLDCTMAEDISGEGCALVPAEDQDVGAWSIYSEYVEIWHAATHQGTFQSIDLGIGDCGGLLHSAYDAFIEVDGAVHGGPLSAGSAFQPDDGGGPDFLQAHMEVGCTAFAIVYHLPSAPIRDGADRFPTVQTTPNGVECGD